MCGEMKSNIGGIERFSKFLERLNFRYISRDNENFKEAMGIFYEVMDEFNTFMMASDYMGEIIDQIDKELYYFNKRIKGSRKFNNLIVNEVSNNKFTFHMDKYVYEKYFDTLGKVIGFKINPVPIFDINVFSSKIDIEGNNFKEYLKVAEPLSIRKRFRRDINRVMESAKGWRYSWDKAKNIENGMLMCTFYYGVYYCDHPSTHFFNKLYNNIYGDEFTKYKDKIIEKNTIADFIYDRIRDNNWDFHWISPYYILKFLNNVDRVNFKLEFKFDITEDTIEEFFKDLYDDSEERLIFDKVLDFKSWLNKEKNIYWERGVPPKEFEYSKILFDDWYGKGFLKRCIDIPIDFFNSKENIYKLIDFIKSYLLYESSDINRSAEKLFEFIIPIEEDFKIYIKEIMEDIRNGKKVQKETCRNISPKLQWG